MNRVNQFLTFGNPLATWLRSLTRYYFVNNQTGDDNNLGFIDAAPGSTFTPGVADVVALKTSEELRKRLPRTGGGRFVVIMFKTRTDAGAYLKKDDLTPDFLDVSYGGYQHLIFRASRDLSNDANDKVDLGGVIDATASGPNGDGSWDVGSVSSFTVTVAAGTLPATDDLVGLKMEFKGNVTAGARTLGNVAVNRTTGTDFDTGEAATLAAGDEFFFMRPGVKFTTVVNQTQQNGPDDAGEGRGVVLAGFEFTDVVNQWAWSGRVSPVFIRVGGTTLLDMVAGQLGANREWKDEAGSLIETQCGVDWRGVAVLDGNGGPLGNMNYSAFHSGCNVQNVSGLGHIGQSSYFGGAVTFGGIIAGVKGGVFGAFFNFGASHTFEHPAVVTTSVGIDGGSMQVARADFTAATSGVTVTGEGCRISLFNTTGIATGSGLDLSGARNAVVNYLAGVTLGGTPDITLAGSVTKTLASLGSDHWVDSAGNLIQGSGGMSTTRTEPGVVGEAPVLSSDPISPKDGARWIKDTGGVRTWNVRISGVTYSTVLI